MKQVVIEPYDPAWADRFEQERALLAAYIGTDAAIEHIGSTSVVGLAAKPIVDILIGVESLEVANKLVSTVTKLGYEYVPQYEAEFPGRRYFRKDSEDGTRLAHIHMVVVGSPFWTNHLYFRNRLRTDNALALGYEKLKRELAERYRNDREAYTDAKTDFIMDVVNEQLKRAREKTQVVARQHLSQGDTTGWFDDLYKQAEGDPMRIPWARYAPNDYLVSWLDAAKRSGAGRRALVIGCGLGDDAEELARRGFDVTAFDIAETAIAWARRRFPDTKVHYRVADLFKISGELAGQFDFVFECYTVQALPRELRKKAVEAVCAFVAPKGELLVVTRGYNGEGLEVGPPWQLTDDELKLFTEKLRAISSEEFWEENNEIRRLRCLFKKD